MKLIRLVGKYAVGEHAYAMVDDEDFDQLSRYRWKAKPNPSGNVYAIRTCKSQDGVTRDIRMHRVVAGYAGPLDIDHVNRNPLDNTRRNLRLASRSENQLNRRDAVVMLRCRQCGDDVVRSIKVGNEERVFYCSAQCKKLFSLAGPHCAVSFNQCRECGATFTARHATSSYCGGACKGKWKRRQWANTDRLQTHYAKAAAYAKAWRQGRGVASDAAGSRVT